jgi:hypothetical protein
VNDDEDLELQALQRQLDDAFETTRPRAGFEDALWSRMQARRPLWRRMREFFAGLVDSVREAPAVPGAAVAALLVVAIGAGVLALSVVHEGGGGSITRSSESGSQFNGAASFGRLPTPALHPPPTADTALPKAPNPGTAAQPAYAVYLGPANLVWAGRFNFQLISAPVYRYSEPSAADADQFAASLGASRQGSAGAGALGSYSGDGFVLGVAGSIQALDREPYFYLTPDSSSLPAPGPAPAATADAFVAAHSLTPTWTYAVAVDQVGDVVRVRYLRQFAVPGAGPAYLVDGLGERNGLEVDLRGGRPLQAIGPMPLFLASAAYPTISTGQALTMALASAPAAPASIKPIPTVNLTSVELVYSLAIAGDHSFYEPAFLFSGTFTYNGVAYVKRVLVPAVDPSQRSS